MAITKAKKVEIAKSLKERIGDASSVVFVNFHKLPVAESTKLRSSLRKAGSGFMVTKKTLLARDVASLLDWRRAAPSASLAHPDDGGHYRVMLVALGAAVGDGATFASTRFTAEGFELGAFSKRCVELA